MIPISKPQFGDEELALLREVLESGIVAQGPKVAQFEAEFTRVSHTKYAVAVSSGTTALHVALLAHGVGPGDEVITSPFTFIASANSILYTGATPRFVDILPDTFNLDPNQIEAAITPRTRAIAGASLRPDGGYGSDHGHRPPSQSRRDRRCGAGARRDL